MGDPKKQRAKYSTPMHPWQKTRIEEEKLLSEEYGLKNKLEIWKMNSKLKNFKAQVKHIIAASSTQSEKEEAQLLKKLRSLGLIAETAGLDEVLGLMTKDIMERRLQTRVYKKGLAKSVAQARQFISHRHIMINGKRITSPSYLVSKEEEAGLSFSSSSAFSDAGHPERQTAAKKEKKKRPEPKKKVKRR